LASEVVAAALDMISFSLVAASDKLTAVGRLEEHEDRK